MKNNIFVLGMLAFWVVSAGCANNGDNADPHAAYYGTWKKGGNILIISANKLELFEDDNPIYKLENLTWTARSNGGATAADYPSGYAIIGTVTYKGGPDYFPNKPGTTEQAETGDLAVEYLYIHGGGQSLVWGDWNDPNHFGIGYNQIFVKQ